MIKSIRKHEKNGKKFFENWRIKMLKVYGAEWCPHCTLTADYLTKNNIEFEYIKIEKEHEEIVQKIIEVNGGDDWVIPTLEYNGNWREGKVFNEKELAFDLKKLGLPV
jgi:mycoredoxin